MQRHEIITLVDITKTNVTDNNFKDSKTQLQRNQQRNYDTLCQVISLRSNYYNTFSDKIELDINNDYFSKNVFDCKKQTFSAWRFFFDTERVDPFGVDYELLKMDLNMVPVIPGLSESFKQQIPYFITIGELKNTTVRTLLS